MNFPIYVINLAERTDRHMESTSEAKRCEISIKFVSALNAESFLVDTKPIRSPQASACWFSHMKAMRELVSSGHEYGLILEDDFEVNDVQRFKRILINVCEFDWEIYQIGFLNNGIRSKVDLIFANYESYFFILLAKLTNRFSIFSSKLGNRLRINRAQNLGIGFAVDDLRAGAHAYFIKAETAKIILRDYQNQNVLTTDGFLISTNWTRPFRSLRLKKSVVGQSSSKSSIRI